MAEKSTTVKRCRNYATVVYPDSAPDGWLGILKEYKVPCFVSPLHDKDVNPDGEVKKPHWHVLIMFDGVKTVDQAKQVFASIGGVGCEVVQSIRGYARYLCHLDNPEKYQYDTASVLCLSGADYPAVIELAIDKYKAISEMMRFCKDNQIYSLAKLMDYASEFRYDWFRCLCDKSAYVMGEYLKSAHWTDSNDSQ